MKTKKKMTLFITINYHGNEQRVEEEQFDSSVVAKYMAKEAFKDGNVLEVMVLKNNTKEVIYFKNEKEELDLGR